jgi:hypothetical protein
MNEGGKGRGDVSYVWSSLCCGVLVGDGEAALVAEEETALESFLDRRDELLGCNGLILLTYTEEEEEGSGRATAVCLYIYAVCTLCVNVMCCLTGLLVAGGGGWEGAAVGSASWGSGRALIEGRGLRAKRLLVLIDKESSTSGAPLSPAPSSPVDPPS